MYFNVSARKFYIACVVYLCVWYCIYLGHCCSRGEADTSWVCPWLTMIPLFQVTTFVLTSGFSGLPEALVLFLDLTQVCQSESFPGKLNEVFMIRAIPRNMSSHGFLPYGSEEQMELIFQEEGKNEIRVRVREVDEA